MTEEFIQVLAKIRRGREFENFLIEFLTSTERTMLAKRLAIIYLINKKYSFANIERILKVSPSTVARFWKANQNNAFLVIQKQIEADRAKKIFWDELEWLVRLGMPPMGRGRWGFNKNSKFIKKYRKA